MDVEEMEDRKAHRAKCAAMNTPKEFRADDPSRQANVAPAVTIIRGGVDSTGMPLATTR